MHPNCTACAQTQQSVFEASTLKPIHLIHCGTFVIFWYITAQVNVIRSIAWCGLTRDMSGCEHYTHYRRFVTSERYRLRNGGNCADLCRTVDLACYRSRQQFRAQIPQTTNAMCRPRPPQRQPPVRPVPTTMPPYYVRVLLATATYRTKVDTGL